MIEYKFVEVTGKGVINTNYESEDGRSAQEVIEDYARSSYRFVGILPKKYVGYGTLKSYDLVFEKI
jgi:hypothetical protein